MTTKTVDKGVAGKKVDCDCGGLYLAFDEARVASLEERITLMVKENGRPRWIRFSPDISHQLTGASHLTAYETINRLTGKPSPAVCDPALPPNSIIFET